jgi:hypothetical protein
MNSNLLMGMMVVFMGLYASQITSTNISTLNISTPAPQSSNPSIEKIEVKPPAPHLNNDLADSQISAQWFKQLLLEPLFQGLKGLQIEIRQSKVWMVLNSEELYEPGSVAVSATWIPVLDRLADMMVQFEKIKKSHSQAFSWKLGIHVQVHSAQAQEQKPSDFGSSAFSLSSTRAEWLGRFLERRNGFRLQKNAVLHSYGAPSPNKKVEFEFTPVD